MSYALTLLVLLTPSSESFAPALAAAAREMLAAGSTIELRVIAGPIDDATARGLATQARAAAVAAVTLDPDGLHARLRVYDARDGRWLERTLEFTPADASDERARAIGFTLGSMLPEHQPAPAVAQEPTPAPSTSPTPAPAQPVAAPREAEPQRAANAGAPPAPAPAPPPWTFAIDAAAQGALAIGGDGSAIGGELGGRFRLSDHFALRPVAALRVGHLEALEADLLALDLGVGAGWRSHDPVPSDPWVLGLRADVFARLQSARRPSAGERSAEAHARWVPGVGLQLEVLYALSPGLVLYADTGAHALLGETDVHRGREQVASLAPVELAFSLGASLRF